MIHSIGRFHDIAKERPLLSGYFRTYLFTICNFDNEPFARLVSGTATMANSKYEQIISPSESRMFYVALTIPLQIRICEAV